MRKLLALLVSVFLLLPLCTAAEETDEVYLAEPFGCEDLDGNPFDASLFDGAQLLLIDVWEPWCPWCLEEMPDLNELYELNRENGFLIVGLSGVSTAPGYDAKKTAADMGITYPLVNGTDALLPFRPEGFPSTYVYQRQEDGRFLFLGVITGYMPREDWNRFLTEYLPGAVTEAAAAENK